MPPIMAPLAAPMAAPLPASPAMAPPTAPTAAPRAPPRTTPPWGAWAGGGGGRGHAWIDAGLLGRPGLALRLVLGLSLRRLTLLRVHERLCPAGATAQQEDTGHRSCPRPADRHSHRLSPFGECRSMSLRSFRLDSSAGSRRA